jgi:hypothetical protein
MKKTILAVLILTLAGSGAWAAPSTDAKAKKEKAIQAHQQHLALHAKKGKPARKVGGKAQKGAKQVSPDPVNKNKPGIPANH